MQTRLFCVGIVLLNGNQNYVHLKVSLSQRSYKCSFSRARKTIRELVVASSHYAIYKTFELSY